MLPSPPPPPKFGVRKLLVGVVLGACLGASLTVLAVGPVPSLASQIADDLANGCVPIIQADDVPASVVDAYVNGLEANGARDIETAVAVWKGTVIRVVTAKACNG